jgi:hypothetical protein
MLMVDPMMRGAVSEYWSVKYSAQSAQQNSDVACAIGERLANNRPNTKECKVVNMVRQEHVAAYTIKGKFRKPGTEARECIRVTQERRLCGVSRTLQVSLQAVPTLSESAVDMTVSKA